MNFFVRFSSSSLGSWNWNIIWHSRTILIFPVQNNFMKKRFTTQSKLLKSALFRGQASSPYNNTGIHLLWISCSVTFSGAKRPIFPKISLPDLWKDRFASCILHLNKLELTTWIPRYFISLTHGNSWPFSTNYVGTGNIKALPNSQTTWLFKVNRHI